MPHTHRAGLIGDVHGEAEALEATLAFLRGVPGLDALLCTGDLPAKFGEDGTDRCCHLLREYHVYTVRGNHDRWFADMWAQEEPLSAYGDADEVAANFIETLPPTRAFSTPRGPLLLCHGTGTNDMDGVYPRDTDAALGANWQLRKLHAESEYRFLVCGHTHQRLVRVFDHLTIINAGTLLWSHAPGFAVADFAQGTVQFYDIALGTLTIQPAQSIALP